MRRQVRAHKGEWNGKAESTELQRRRNPDRFRCRMKTGRVRSCETLLHASQVQATADGSRCRSGRQTRRKIEELVARRIEKHGQIDEQKRAEENGEREAEKAAHTRAKEE